MIEDETRRRKGAKGNLEIVIIGGKGARMLVIGERLNTSRKGLHDAVENRDEGFLKEIARLAGRGDSRPRVAGRFSKGQLAVLA